MSGGEVPKDRSTAADYVPIRAQSSREMDAWEAQEPEETIMEDGNFIPIPGREPPPPMARMRLGNRADGQVMSAMPRADLSEFGRDWQLMSPVAKYLLMAALCVIVGLVVATVGKFIG